MARMITTAEEYGFSARGGVDWSTYAACRPVYPPSFFQRIYAYHGAKPQAAWSQAHDVGAGTRIVSAGLAGKFDRVVMSDPNDGYAALGYKILVDELGIPAAKWRAVKRVYINTGESVEPFALDDRTAESKVGEGEEKILEEADEDWMDVKGIDWFKPYFATWTPRVPDEEIRDLWDQLEATLNGQHVKVETPAVLIFGTKV
ncbi:hypothetical protein ANO14919_060360 [Xylariales sp. No.14919]|nr:hypothetical protein ANO14919_060360 [Xylariales sp. No.14919]